MVLVSGSGDDEHDTEISNANASSGRCGIEK